MTEIVLLIQHKSYTYMRSKIYKVKRITIFTYERKIVRKTYSGKSEKLTFLFNMEIKKHAVE
jgi:hypothetical protein